jgi:hypothetical protein
VGRIVLRVPEVAEDVEVVGDGGVDDLSPGLGERRYDAVVRGPALDEALISAVQSWAEAKGDRARLSI